MKDRKNHLRVEEVDVKVSDAFSSHNNEGSFFDNLITVEKLSSLLGKSPKTIRNWVSRQEIPFIRIKGKTYFLEDQLRDWVLQQQGGK